MEMTGGKERKVEKVHLERTVEEIDGWYVVLVQPA
jgi:hypothetical protein